MRGQVRIPVEQIAGISLVPAGIGMQGIRFDLAGGTQRQKVGPLGSHKDLAGDPQALTFASSRLPEFTWFAEQVEAAMRASHSSGSIGVRPPDAQAVVPPLLDNDPAPMGKPRPETKSAGWGKVVFMVVGVVVVVGVILAAVAPKNEKTATEGTPPPEKPAGCMAATDDDGPFENWLDRNSTDGSFEASARLNADGGTYLAARLNNVDHDVVVWWETAGNDKGAPGVKAVDLNTETLTWLDSTDLVDSRSPGYAQVKECLR